MLVPKSPIYLQHPPGGGSPGCLERVWNFWDTTSGRCGCSSGGVKGGGMRSASLARVDAAPWACSGRSAAVCHGGDLRPGGHLTSASWVIYDRSLWKKVLQPLRGVLLLAERVGAGDRKQPEEYASSLPCLGTSRRGQKTHTHTPPTCITVAHFSMIT